MAVEATVLDERRRALLSRHLDGLVGALDAATHLAVDPIRFARRYTDPRDAELAGLFAASLAYGRVDLFGPVIAAVLAAADARGGPRAWIEGFEPERDATPLLPLTYRWNRGVDLVLLAATLRRVIAAHGGLEPLFPWRSEHADAGPALAAAVTTLRAAAIEAASSCGVAAQTFTDLPRGLRMFLPSPADGSACKRWNMYLRWMVRPTREGVDLGLWRSLPPSALVMPMDTHTTRIAGLIGLTARSDASWRTALEVTRNLRTLDAEDPIRFDFALAHLGISGACTRRHDPTVCPSCPLRPTCVHGGPFA